MQAFLLLPFIVYFQSISINKITINKVTDDINLEFEMKELSLLNNHRMSRMSFVAMDQNPRATFYGTNANPGALSVVAP